MRILIVGQPDKDRERIVRRLRSALDRVECVEAGDAGMYDRALEDDEIDLVLTEAVLEWTTGLTVLQDIQTYMRDVPVIMVTGSENETLAVEGLKAGLAGYVPKDHLEQLVPAVERAVEHVRRDQALRQSKEAAATAELDISRRIQEMSTRMIHADEIDPLFQEILDTALAILHAESGSILLFCPKPGNLGERQHLGRRGFSRKSVQLWRSARPTQESPWAMALREMHRTDVPAVEKREAIYGTEDQVTYPQNIVRTFQSTPLLSSSGDLLGMLSLHWSPPYEPTASELRALDTLAQLAANLTQRRQSAQAARESEERYRTLMESLGNDAPHHGRRETGEWGGSTDLL
jgi:DNA-binding response OmpR family regulator